MAMQTPAVTETHRGSPYAATIPALTQPALVAASLLAVAVKGKP